MFVGDGCREKCRHNSFERLLHLYGCSSDSGNKLLDSGAIRGIVVGAVVAAIGVAIVFAICCERKGKSHTAQNPALDMTLIADPVHNRHSSRRTGTIGASQDTGSSEDNRDINRETKLPNEQPTPIHYELWGKGGTKTKPKRVSNLGSSSLRIEGEEEC